MSDIPIPGTIKWFNSDKGYGFITAAGFDKDVFLHVKQLRASGISGAVNEGDAVKFVINHGPKGAFATSIALANGPAGPTLEAANAGTNPTNKS